MSWNWLNQPKHLNTVAFIYIYTCKYLESNILKIFLYHYNLYKGYLKIQSVVYQLSPSMSLYTKQIVKLSNLKGLVPLITITEYVTQHFSQEMKKQGKKQVFQCRKYRNEAGNTDPKYHLTQFELYSKVLEGIFEDESVQSRLWFFHWSCKDVRVGL